MAAARAQIKGKHRLELACDSLLFVLISTLSASLDYVCVCVCGGSVRISALCVCVCVEGGNVIAVWTGIVWAQERCVKVSQKISAHRVILKFEEETSKMLHLEHGFVWC